MLWQPMTAIQGFRGARGLAALCLALTVALAGCSGPDTTSGEAADAGTATGKTYQLVLDFADKGEKRTFSALPWKQEMTAMDSLQQASAAEGGFEFEHRGSGATAFVTTIDGVKNEGGKEGARNWIFKINGSKSPQSAGVSPLAAGDVVLWKFSTAVE